jgi:hypothetical protein
VDEPKVGLWLIDTPRRRINYSFMSHPIMHGDCIGQFQAAASMAAEAHAGQKIDSTNTPYIAHPMRVAGLVMSVFACCDADVISAALLHDTLEKTTLEPGKISTELGATVLRIVRALTKNEGDEDGYWQALINGSWEARLVKMADAMDHLNCPFEDLPHRIETGGKALALAYSDEEPIRMARHALNEALRGAEVRLATALVPD